jgi:segregation and condensation protein B
MDFNDMLNNSNKKEDKRKNKIKSCIESLLYISNKPVSMQKISKFIEISIEDVQIALDELMDEYKNKGINIIKNENEYRLGTNPENSELIEKYTNEEFMGELTKPSLETLTIIAYRGPITKNELELIRGVNCSLILRNLMIRGLVKNKKNSTTQQQEYSVTFEFLKYLGLTDVTGLPDYDELHSDEIVSKLLNTLQ